MFDLFVLRLLTIYTDPSENVPGAGSGIRTPAPTELQMRYLPSFLPGSRMDHSAPTIYTGVSFRR